MGNRMIQIGCDLLDGFLPWRDDDTMWHWGRWSFLLHDTGWLLARDQLIKLERAWPTVATFSHKRTTPWTR
jgi:hypothetical protein